MKMYELIKRLEHIRDKMESTFSNEFQRGEIDNLIEELIKMTPEVGQIDKTPGIGQPFQPYQPHIGHPIQPSIGGAPWVTTTSPYIVSSSGSATSVTLTNSAGATYTYPVDNSNSNTAYINMATDLSDLPVCYAGTLESKNADSFVKLS